jgi:hypothetical protein
MTIDYSSLLTEEQKRNILNQRVAQFASEAWQHELNKRTCTELGDEAGVENADKALEVLGAAIAVHQQELSSLPTE